MCGTVVLSKRSHGGPAGDDRRRVDGARGPSLVQCSQRASPWPVIPPWSQCPSVSQPSSRDKMSQWSLGRGIVGCSTWSNQVNLFC